ncbi:MAG: hypothetical protein M3380_05650, partial [Chloroflexota bacterium]|nr:hypothetical protein [Chloroflexota bacterium]
MQDAIPAALQPYGLKQAGCNQYRCNAPWRPGSNSRGVALTIDPDAPGGGLWHDHVAKEGGDFRDLAHRLNIPVQQESAPAAPAKDPAYTGLAEYAAAHGVPVDVFRKAGWREGLHFCSTHGRKRRALLFRTRTGERARFIDGDKPKYVSPKGYTACMYGLDRAVALAEQTGQPLVLANGEASTIAAQHFGVAATCQTAGEKRLSDANLAALQA